MHPQNHKGLQDVEELVTETLVIREKRNQAESRQRFTLHLTFFKLKLVEEHGDGRDFQKREVREPYSYI